jgi:hypothetical protein
MDDTNPAVEVADNLTLSIVRDGQRMAVRLSPAEARAIGGALVEFATRPALVSAAADAIREESIS